MARDVSWDKLAERQEKREADILKHPKPGEWSNQAALMESVRFA